MDCWATRSPLAITADKAYDSEKVQQQSKTKALCRSSRTAASPSGKPIAPSASIGDDTKSKTFSAARALARFFILHHTGAPTTSALREGAGAEADCNSISRYSVCLGAGEY